MHDIDPTAAAVFTLIVLGGAAAVYLFALVRFFAWFYTEWRKERADRERRTAWQRRLAEATACPTCADMAANRAPSVNAETHARWHLSQRSSSASGFGSIDGSGNVRVVGGKQS